MRLNKGFFFFLYVLSWNIYGKRIRDMLIRFKITIERNICVTFENNPGICRSIDES